MASGTLTYNRPDERLDDASGDVDPTYESAWLVDGRTPFPALKTGSGVVWSLTGSAQEVGILVAGHHLLDGGLSLVISGDITDTLTVPAHGADGIPFNAHKIITPVSSVNNIDLTISGNTAPAVIIGEFVAGKARTLPITLSRYTGFERNVFATQRPIDRNWLPGYDKGQVAEVWTGTCQLNATKRAELLAWQASQRSMTRPSVVVLESDSFDAPLCMFGYLQVGRQVPLGLLWRIDVRFLELPRTRW